MRRLLQGCVCAALLLTAVACKPDLPLRKDALAEHEQQWHRKAPSSYAFTLTYGAMIGPRTARIRVVDGRVAAVSRVKGRQPLRSFDKALTIDGVFDLLRADLRRADHVQVSYDGTWGFPAGVFVDEMANAIDDEHGYTLTQFVSLSRQ